MKITMKLCRWCRDVCSPYTVGNFWGEEPCDYCGCKMMVVETEVSDSQYELLERHKYLKVWNEVEE